MRPETDEQLIEAIRTARSPLKIQGGGTRAIGDTSGDTLETAGLSGITLYEPGSLTLVAKAGTPLELIEATLAAENQRLPFEPPQLGPVLGGEGRSTIGGVVAANASGPRRVQAGACRDSLIGIALVDGTGTLIRNGGRVMKNVTGYDLVKLVAGSHGTLGVLTEVAFKLLPKPETEATLLLHGLTIARAQEAMTRALSTPFEVSGAAMLPARADGTHAVALRLEGFETQVSGRLPRLEAALANLGTAERIPTPEASAAIWREIRDLDAFASATDLCRVSIRPSHLSALLEGVPGAKVMADWGGGLVTLGGGPELLAKARAFVARNGGHATRLKGGATPAFQPEAPEVARLSQGIRAKFDPRGIFNPGLMAQG